VEALNLGVAQGARVHAFADLLKMSLELVDGRAKESQRKRVRLVTMEETPADEFMVVLGRGRNQWPHARRMDRDKQRQHFGASTRCYEVPAVFAK